MYGEQNGQVLLLEHVWVYFDESLGRMVVVMAFCSRLRWRRRGRGDGWDLKSRYGVFFGAGICGKWYEDVCWVCVYRLKQ